MQKRVVGVLFLLITFSSVYGQYVITGKVLDEKNKMPVEYAYLVIENNEIWTTSGEKGEFKIKNLPAGEMTIAVSCLGYAKVSLKLNLTADVSGLVIYLPESNLALKEVVITAERKKEEMATSYVIDHTGLDHLQMSGLADVMSLLPGGLTNRYLHLASGNAQRIALRSSTSGEMGNSSFGTAIEVDGVRLSKNASLEKESDWTSGMVYGVDTRNIASGNIASVELITGVASVEYGDMTNGVVKVNTKKGKSPLTVEMSIKPNTKQIAANKGFGLGTGAGVLNLGIEHTRSISSLVSPYTSYARNAVSLLYENTFNKKNQPLMLTLGLTGNIGGYNSKADPDAFKDTYLKENDNTIRAHFKMNYLFHKPWITNLELSGSVAYSDKLREENTNKSSSSSTAAIHAKEEGYFVAGVYDDNPNAPLLLIPPGYWYQLQYIDDKPLDFTGKIKANQARKFGRVNSNLLAGVDFNHSINKGRGKYYDDLRYAPSWREYRYDEIPSLNNVAVYLEEKLNIPVSASDLQLAAGLRSDMTFIEKSAYGMVSSLSPRVNMKYSFRNEQGRFPEQFTIRAGWGKSVKLPSFSVLYPPPSYRDILSFAPGARDDGSIFYAYYVMPSGLKTNPNLQWQSSRQWEIGFEMKLKGIAISLSAFTTQTLNAYKRITEYQPFAYKLTDQSALEACPIPSADRQYQINQTTGIVTVSDKTGNYPAQDLAYRERKTFKGVDSYANGSPAVRKGLEWIVDFGKIPLLQTSVRLDGNYYHYRGVEETITQGMPASAQNMADGNPYKYVGFYAGGDLSANGKESKQLNTNLVFTTHIPAIRLIVSLRLEGSFLHYDRNLSEYTALQRGFVLDDRGDYFPSATQTDIYGGNRFVGLYPLYYVTYDDMQTKIPFAEKLKEAKRNDPALYNELVKMVVKANTDYYFNANNVSNYFFANFSITKEIGDYASVSFNATNFANTMQLVHSSWSGTKSSLYQSSYIPDFYYGLSLRIKFK
jgi:outer membrane cobalamin receptor